MISLPTYLRTKPLLPAVNSRLRILHAVWSHPGISRVDIAASLGLDKSTVGALVGAMVERGILVEVELGKPGPAGGRRRVALEISNNIGVIAGIEVQPDARRVCLIDANGREIDALKTTNALSSMDAIRAAVEDSLSLASKQGKRLLGVGLGLAGLIDSASGAIRSSIPLGVEAPVKVVETIRNEYGLDAFVENDARCCALNLMAFGDPPPPLNFVYALLEQRAPASHPCTSPVGVGFSFVLGGKIHRGTSGFSGEFRSVLWKPGNSSQFSIADKDIMSTQEAGKGSAKLLRELALHIALFANSLDVSAVYLGGTTKLADERFVSIVSEAIAANRPYGGSGAPSVSLDCQECTVARGAAAAFLSWVMGESDTPEHSTDLIAILDEPDPRKRTG